MTKAIIKKIKEKLSNSILTPSPISWNGAQYLISENKQTVVKKRKEKKLANFTATILVFGEKRIP